MWSGFFDGRIIWHFWRKLESTCCHVTIQAIWKHSWFRVVYNVYFLYQNRNILSLLFCSVLILIHQELDCATTVCTMRKSFLGLYFVLLGRNFVFILGKKYILFGEGNRVDFLSQNLHAKSWCSMFLSFASQIYTEW